MLAPHFDRHLTRANTALESAEAGLQNSGPWSCDHFRRRPPNLSRKVPSSFGKPSPRASSHLRAIDVNTRTRKCKRGHVANEHGPQTERCIIGHQWVATAHACFSC